MPTVRELTALYENFLIGPRRGDGVCETCFTFTDGYRQCYPCGRREPWLDGVAAISYSVAHEQLHRALASYKRLTGAVAVRLQAELAALLWRYLEGHERCLARAAGVPRFDLVTTVPSSDRERDHHHPLHRMVGEVCGPTRARHERLLRRSVVLAEEHDFERRKYHAVRALKGQTVLIIDDTWTTGASLQSAAAALKAAGAGTTAALVIGRHVKRDWHDNDRRLRQAAHRFDWQSCVLCANSRPAVAVVDTLPAA